MKYKLIKDGNIIGSNNQIYNGKEINNTNISIDHLRDHIITIQLPKGQIIKIKVKYSCHCWTRKFDEHKDEDQIKIMDGKNSRVFCNDRFNWSTNLNNLFTNLENNRFFLSNAERNYGTYSVQVNNNKNLYTAFFRLKNEKGKFNGIRYQLVLFVESAYFREKPKKVQNVKIATIVSKALEGEMVKKFRR